MSAPTQVAFVTSDLGLGVSHGGEQLPRRGGAPRVPRASDRMTVVIAVPLEPQLVEAIREVDSRLKVLYEPDLLPPVRYPNDHRGIDGFERDPESERRWQTM